ncbi:hypothetical protein HY988_06440 [Candidatus Micrarchaeota archaeon]|nr:hypothetical protein [Candidatus Micrarchaeota archaeon]
MTVKPNVKSQQLREGYARNVKAYFTLLAKEHDCRLSGLSRELLKRFGARIVNSGGLKEELEVDLPVAVTTVLFKNRAKEIGELLVALRREIESRGGSQKFAAVVPLVEKTG